MISEADLWGRVGLLAREGDTEGVARALARGETGDPVAGRAQGAALAQRGLRPWVPPGGDAAGIPVLLLQGRPPPPVAVAVVGARASDDYGLACAARVAQDAVALGAAVISGGAEGCDAAAHRAALGAGGITAVVLPAGHDHPYPAAHRPLYAEVAASGGAVVSPCWPTARPVRLRFLKRNRVIAALASVVVVARAGRRSGALSTAREARELGRPLLAVPGSVGEGLSQGANGLLASGAAALTSRRDLARALGVSGQRGAGDWPVTYLGDPSPWPSAGAAEHGEVSPVSSVSPVARAVLERLSAVRCLDLDSLLVATGLSVEDLVAALSELEIAGWVDALPGRRYGARRSAAARSEAT
jgi:DNA processing protein